MRTPCFICIPSFLATPLSFARQAVTNFLTSKVRDGYFTEDESKSTARKILHDNVIRIYKISP